MARKKLTEHTTVLLTDIITPSGESEAETVTRMRFAGHRRSRPKWMGLLPAKYFGSKVWIQLLRKGGGYPCNLIVTDEREIDLYFVTCACQWQYVQSLPQQATR